ncbi:calcium-responsive transcription factor [Oncorhynchus masou masou]|uniref:calcium-responsive transcription factor n=1 Tax=Oncorhynchus masou masou TaxID=90313 RepID=UPI003182C93F
MEEQERAMEEDALDSKPPLTTEEDEPKHTVLHVSHITETQQEPREPAPEENETKPQFSELLVINSVAPPDSWEPVHTDIKLEELTKTEMLILSQTENQAAIQTQTLSQTDEFIILDQNGQPLQCERMVLVTSRSDNGEMYVIPSNQLGGAQVLLPRGHLLDIIDPTGSCGEKTADEKELHTITLTAVTDDSGSLTTVTSAVTDDSGSLTTVTSAVTDDSGSLTTVTSAVTDDSGSLTTVTSAVTDDSGSLTTVPSAVTDDSGSLTTVTLAVTDDSGSLTTVTSAVTDDSGSLTTVPSAVTDDSGSLTTVTSAVTDDSGSLTTVPSAVTDDSGSSTTVTSAVTDDSGSLTTVTSAVTDDSGSLTTVTSAVTDDSGSLTTVTSAVTDDSGSLTTVTSAVTDDSGSLTTVTSAVTDDSGSLTTVTSAVTDDSGSLTTVPSAVTDDSGSSTTVTSAVTDDSGSLTTVTSAVTDDSGSSTTVTSAVTDDSGSLTTVTSAVTDDSGSSTTVTSAVTDDSGSLTTVTSAVTDDSGSSTTVTSAVTDDSGSSTTVTSAVTDDSGSLTTVTSAVTDDSGSLTTVTSAVTDDSGSLTTVTSAVTDDSGSSTTVTSAAAKSSAQSSQVCFTSLKPLPANAPNWALRLHNAEKIGDSYRGYCNTDTELETILLLHKQQTNSVFGTRQSPSPAKPASRLMWKSQYVPYDGVPFVNAGSRAIVMECQYGPRRKGLQPKKTAEQNISPNIDYKATCPARIYIKKVCKFPQHRVPTDPNVDKRVVRQEQEKAFFNLRKTLWDVGGVLRYYMQLPTQKAHLYHDMEALLLPPAPDLLFLPMEEEVKQEEEEEERGCVCDEGAEDGGTMPSRLHPRVAEKIRELVEQGYHQVYQVRKQLRRFVEREMFKSEEVPERHNLCYFPTVNDIKNHIHEAQKTFQQAGGVTTDITQWTEVDPMTVTLTLTPAPAEVCPGAFQRVGVLEGTDTFVPEAVQLFSSLTSLQPKIFAQLQGIQLQPGLCSFDGGLSQSSTDFLELPSPPQPLLVSPTQFLQSSPSLGEAMTLADPSVVLGMGQVVMVSSLGDESVGTHQILLEDGQTIPFQIVAPANIALNSPVEVKEEEEMRTEEDTVNPVD